MRRCANNHLTDKENFHKGKHRCKDCYKKEGLAKRQLKLSQQYESGDTRIDQCQCGLYYVNETAHSGDSYKLRIACQSCAKAKNDMLRFHKNSKESLWKHNGELRIQLKEYIAENARLRRLVSRYQRTG